MKKKLDVAAFTSSLRGESVFFPTKDNKPVPGHAGEPLENQRAMSKGDDATMRRPDEKAQRLYGDKTTRLPDDATTRRNIKRESMNFYVDQLKYLRHYSLQKQMQGENIGVSEMVREAIDTYIAKLKEQH